MTKDEYVSAVKDFLSRDEIRYNIEHFSEEELSSHVNSLFRSESENTISSRSKKIILKN